jgi:hypothetical protein
MQSSLDKIPAWTVIDLVLIVLSNPCWQQQHLFDSVLWFFPCSIWVLESSFSAALDNGDASVASLIFMWQLDRFDFLSDYLFPCVDLFSRSIFLAVLDLFCALVLIIDPFCAHVLLIIWFWCFALSGANPCAGLGRNRIDLIILR